MFSVSSDRHRQYGVNSDSDSDIFIRHLNHTIQQNVITNNTNRKKHVGRLPLRHCYVASMGATKERTCTRFEAALPRPTIDIRYRVSKVERQGFTPKYSMPGPMIDPRTTAWQRARSNHYRTSFFEE